MLLLSSGITSRFIAFIGVGMLMSACGIQTDIRGKDLNSLSVTLPEVYSARVGNPFLSAAPTVTRGTLVSCAISPALPTGLTLNSTTCVISGTPTSDHARSTYTITTSSATTSKTASVLLEVLAGVPNIAYSAASYTFTLNQAGATSTVPTNSGGAITSCSITAGTLPTGLSINSSTCEISGTPTVVVNPATSVSVTPVNGVGAGTARSILLTVNNIVPNIAYSAGIYTFALNAAVSVPAPTNTGGAITGCTVTSGTLPVGLSISNANCSISGSSSVVIDPSTSITVTATNAVGSSIPRTIGIRIYNIVPNIAYSTSSYTFNLNQASSTTTIPTNSGGAITSCSVTSGSLPAGLSISATTCEISGTPTALATNASVTITPVNAVGSGTARTISITVSDIPPNIAYSAGSYTFNVNASGSSTGVPTNTGGAITSCPIVFGVLPAGMTINATTCEISGTPTAVATSTIGIKPLNAAGSATTRTLTITINNVVPNIAYSASTYTFSLNQSGATTGIPTNIGGAITGCTAVSGNGPLPTGMSISATTCEISGTPTQVFTATSFFVTASNSVGNAVTRTISLEVTNTVPNIAYSASSYDFNENQSSTTGTPTNTGGAITGCTISNGTLPAGLSINNTTCVISGTPATGGLTTTVQIRPTNSVGAGDVRTLGITVNGVAPNIAYSASSYFDRTTHAFTTGVPTNSGGAITSCSVTSGALPTGLTLNNTTCEISGSFTYGIDPAISVTIRPANATGLGASRTLQFSADDPPQIAYSSSSYTFYRNQSSSTGTPIRTGGSIAFCNSNVALPAGMSFNPGCGIVGTPTATMSATNYTINAGNSTWGPGDDQHITITVLAQSTPTVTSASNPCADGTMNIVGTGFINGATVVASGAACTSVVFNSSTSISCNWMGIAGKSVVVTNPDGGSASVNFSGPFCP